MKSSVSHVVDYREMKIPQDMFVIEIPSWQAVAQPLIDYAKKDYARLTGESIDQLEDDHVAMLEIPANSIAELKRMGTEVYRQKALDQRFYLKILPLILSNYAENSNTILNDQEVDQYVTEYMDRVAAYAENAQMDLETYGRSMMGIQGSVEEEFHKRAKEDFIYKLVANHLFQDQAKQLKEEDYDAYIQAQVLSQGIDPIELKAAISFQNFKEGYPEMTLSQEIYDYYYPKIHFEINPQADLTLD